MKLYNIPETIKTIIFDIDGTLYTNALYVFEQVDAQVRHYAHISGITEKEARDKINAYRKQWSAEHGGKKISLGNTFTAFGITIEESIKWRNELLNPEHFLKKDDRLIKTITELAGRYKLICVTNNPVLPARKTLEAIGISDFFPEIVGLDTCLKSKPAVEPFQTAVDWLSKSSEAGVKAENCLAIGDRYDMDIKLPLEMGMGGILVSGVEEVYQISKYVL